LSFLLPAAYSLLPTERTADRIYPKSHDADIFKEFVKDRLMAAPSKKKALKRRKSSLKQRIVSVVVIVVPALIIIAWLVMTILYHEPSAAK
jgi:hypothetical protein